jgi:hypothetical protein
MKLNTKHKNGIKTAARISFKTSTGFRSAKGRCEVRPSDFSLRSVFGSSIEFSVFSVSRFFLFGFFERPSMAQKAVQENIFR